MAYRKILWFDTAFLPYHCKLGHSINPSVIRRWPDIFSIRVGSSLVTSGLGAQLTWTLPWNSDNVCCLQPF